MGRGRPEKGRRDSFDEPEDTNDEDEIQPGAANRISVSATSMGGRISNNMGE